MAQRLYLPTPLIRFERSYEVEHVAASARPDLGPCWLWTRKLNNLGYAPFRYNGRPNKAHRFSYEHYKGPIPAGLEIDHLCRIRHCVNPDHLEAVTHLVNIRRSKRSTATHCKRGHLFSPENTFRRPDGSRKCRRCDVIRWVRRNKSSGRRSGVTQLELAV